jgi:hypothetical protein
MATLPLDHIPSVPVTTYRDEVLHQIFVMAVEIGMLGWAETERYRWNYMDDKGIAREARDFIAVSREARALDECAWADPTVQHVIDRDTIIRGIHRAAMHHRDDAPVLQALNLCQFDKATFDAIDADIIVQFGLFGAQRYGTDPYTKTA